MANRLTGFAEFVYARRRALSRTAYLLTGDHTTAEDLLQSALTKTAAHWPRVVAGGAPEAYVRRVMLNERSSRWRRQRRATEHLTDLPPDRADSGDVADAAVNRLMLAAALTHLTPRQRAVLYLRFYEDRTEAATAAELGCSIGTVKRHASDALVRLRALVPGLVADAKSPEVRS